MKERRQFVRLDTRLPVQYIVLSDGVPRSGATKDIGGGGICLFAEQPLLPGTRLRVSMGLPGRAEPSVFTAEVAWCESYEVIGKTERNQQTEIGVRFVEIAPADRDAILQWVILSFTS